MREIPAAETVGLLLFLGLASSFAACSRVEIHSAQTGDSSALTSLGEQANPPGSSPNPPNPPIPPSAPNPPIPAASYSATRLRTGILPYTGGPAGIETQVAQWMASKFDLIVDGTVNVAPYLSTRGGTWAKYVDGTYAYTDELYFYVHQTAAANAFPNYENMLLHMNQDYTPDSGLTWANLDQFDNFEQPAYLQNGMGSPDQAVNGAFTLVGSTYTDVTATLYENTQNTIVSDRLLLGYAEPFDLINLNIAISRRGGSAAWQYWNGSAWAGLTSRTDSTSGLTASGAIQFTPPADWVPSIVNGSQSKYWVRLTVTGASTPPALAKVWGDDWSSHAGSFSCRGWSSTDPNRVNVGLGNLEYNPTPPANATARFRYQARVTGLFQNNATFGNPADIQNGKYTWNTAVLADYAVNYANVGLNYNGAFIDDAGESPQISAPALGIESLTSELGGQSWEAAVATSLTDLRNSLRQAYGNSFKVAANTPDVSLGLLEDFQFFETNLLGAPLIGNVQGNPDSSFLPANNPNGTLALFAGWDNAAFGQTDAGQFFVWDRGNRSPIALMAAFYVVGNPNTAMFYNTLGYGYDQTDEVYTWSPATALTSSVGPDLSTNSKSFTLSDDSGISVAGGAQWGNPSNANTPEEASSIYGYAFKIGNDIIQPFQDSANHWHSFTPITGNYPAGTAVEYAVVHHQSTDPIPDASTVWYWGTFFPAMDIDLGAPDPNGWNGGAGDQAYILPSSWAAQNGGTYPFGPGSGNPTVNCTSMYACPEWWRRDFMNAHVFVHVLHDGNNPAEANTYGPVTPIALDTTYYPLKADGHTSAGINSLQLRAGEAAILMKYPL